MFDAFKLWCWRRLLRVLSSARRSNQSILKEISPGCSLEGLMLKLKLQYFGHLMGRGDSLEKTLMLGGIGAGGEGDDRGWDGWVASLTWWTWVWVNSGSWWWTGRPGVLQSMGWKRVSLCDKVRTYKIQFKKCSWVKQWNCSDPMLMGLSWWHDNSPQVIRIVTVTRDSARPLLSNWIMNVKIWNRSEWLLEIFEISSA